MARLRLRLGPDTGPIVILDPKSGLMQRSGALTTSLAIHALVAGLILSVSPGQVGLREEKVKDRLEALIPKHTKLVWYNLRQALPKVDPVRKIGEGTQPQGSIKAARTLIAMPPKAKPGTQFVWRPAPKLELQQELKSPNVIAFTAPSPPPAPEKPRIKPRTFVPPPQPNQRAAPRGAPLVSPVAAPQLSAGALPQASKDVGNVLAGLPVAVPKRQVRAFVPPPGGGGMSASGRGTGGGPPQLDAGAAPSVGSGVPNANLTAAIIGLNPRPGADAVPEGSRAAQISMAPNVGPPSSGAGGAPGAVRLPDIAVNGPGGPGGPGASGAGGRGRTADAAMRQPGRVVYETPSGLTRATFSAPLRPGARTIPAPIEVRFGNRTVYAIVVGRPRLPHYSGDWNVWFTETQPGAGDARVAAPTPLRKYEQSADPPPLLNPVDGRVLLVATIRKDGRLESVSVLRTYENRILKGAVDDLWKWEFRPAMRDGTPVDVEAVIEIPFRLPTDSVTAAGR